MGHMWDMSFQIMSNIIITKPVFFVFVYCIVYIMCTKCATVSQHIKHTFLPLKIHSRNVCTVKNWWTDVSFTWKRQVISWENHITTYMNTMVFIHFNTKEHTSCGILTLQSLRTYQYQNTVALFRVIPRYNIIDWASYVSLNLPLSKAKL